MSAPDPERLLSLLEAFINAPSWAESRRIVEGAPELLTEEADALLGVLLAQYQEDAQTVRILEEHRALLRRCRAESIEAAFSELEDLDAEEALQALLERAESDPEACAALEDMQREAMAQLLIQAVLALAEARSAVQVLAVAREHSVLLTEEGLAFVWQSIEDARQMGQDDMVRHIEERYEILSDLHRAGATLEQLEAVAVATAAIPSELRAVLKRLGPDLGWQLLEIVDRASSQEELEVQLDKHPELREALVQANARVGQALGDVPAEIAPTLQELDRLGRRADLPRRVELCRQALHRLDRERNPALWAALQDGLASSLAQMPAGDRAENLEQAIHHYTQALEVHTRRAFPADWAMTQNNLANAYRSRICGDRADNLEQAIHHYRQALEVIARHTDPERWANTQNNLAIACYSRIHGDRADNLEQAIHHYSRALEVYTRQADPDRWAVTQYNLALAFANRVRGDRAENLERAIHHHTQALEVYTRQADPERWAMTQNNLANAYADRIRGDRADNLERAIHHYSQALEVRTRQPFPADWAMTQNNLANAYLFRIRGDQAENLEQAIEHYHQALEVYTRQAFPADWAMTQNNLAAAYTARIRGDRAENVERAIHYHTQALEIYTCHTDPERWAITQDNLANAYRNRIRGDRAENVEQAIHHISQALEVFTRQTFPADWARTQNNLAIVYAHRIRGDRADNLERAIHHHTQALEILTCQTDPERWAATQHNLAATYADRIRSDQAENLERAIHHYTQALEVYTRQAFPADWAMTQNNLAIAYHIRIRGDRAENLERAIQHVNQALEIYSGQAFPERWAATQNNLANAYRSRIRGDRAENLERAIHHYNQALEVYTRQAFPTDWAQTVNNLATAYADRIRGDRAENLERAIHHYDQALEVRTHQAFPLDWAQTVNNLAIAYSDRICGDRTENLGRAIHHHNQALEVYKPQVWPERARGVSRSLGAAHFAAGDWPAAHAAFAQARYLTEQFYADALLREVREQEAGANAAMYARDAFCLAQLGDLPAAWASLETGRTRALRDGLDQARARRALATASQAVQDEYAELDGRERALRDSLQRPENDPHYQPYHLVRDELETVTQELQLLREELLAAAGIELGEPSPEEIQALSLLQDGRTGLLSLAVTEHGTLALLLTTRKLRQAVVRDLTETNLRAMVWEADEELGSDGWLGAYLAQFAALYALRDAAFSAALSPDSQEHSRAAEEAHIVWQAARESWQDTIAETLTALGRRLWLPLDRMLQEAGCERVVLVPQGMLCLLPLHACLLDGDERLCDRYTVAYTPAGSILPQLVQEETPGDLTQALLVANPTGDLRHTPSEALAVGQTFAAAVTLWEQDATQAALVDAARDADVFHVSGHGVYEWLDPERSGLILAAEGATSENGREGNRFTVAEMRDELRLSRARLVALSACETGLVDFRRGLADEYLGLPGILLQAGARAVVASLWAVDDLATALLMRQFYVEWQGGSASIAAALQRAQAWLRTRSRAQVEEALDELDEAWELWRHQDADLAMRRRAVEQYWEIRDARHRLREMPGPPFAHPYWWAAFQAVGDVL